MPEGAFPMRGRAMIRRSTIAVFTTVSLMVAAAPASALTPVKVLGGAADQFRPTSNGTHLAWTLYARSTTTST